MNCKYLALLLLVLSAALAQTPPQTEVQITEMKKLGFLEGKWKGTGWRMQGPGRRVEFAQTENVGFKLGGLGLVVEGAGKSLSSDFQFAALAMMSYDLSRKTILFRSHDQEGRYLEALASVKDGVLEWGFQAGPRKIRYLIRLNEKGQWHEVGESAAEGGEWQKFFEMTLDKL
jgi:hypothetical protein